jgi:hypothetical protein
MASATARVTSRVKRMRFAMVPPYSSSRRFAFGAMNCWSREPFAPWISTAVSARLDRQAGGGGEVRDRGLRSPAAPARAAPGSVPFHPL